MRVIIAALALFSASVMAHPIDALVPLAADLDNNQAKIELCKSATQTETNVVQDCEYIAITGGKILEITVYSLEAEGIAVLKSNRKLLKGIAWDNLSFWQIIYSAWILNDDELLDAVKYIHYHHPELIESNVDPEVYKTLIKGGFVDGK